MERLFGTHVRFFRCPRRPLACTRADPALRSLTSSSSLFSALIAQRWLDESYSSGARAAAFFASVGLLAVQISINVVDNAYSTGMDMAGLFSSYINIRRGAYVGLILSLVLCPWQLLSSAAVFISVLSAYSVFLGPIIGIQVCDYWLVRKRKLKLSDLYHPRPDGIYYFVRGFNPRSFVAWVLGFATQVPGFAANVTPDEVSVGQAWHELFYLAFPLGFAISFCVHYLLNFIWPPAGLGVIDGTDYFGTFEPDEALRLGVSPASESDVDAVLDGMGTDLETDRKHINVAF